MHSLNEPWDYRQAPVFTSLEHHSEYGWPLRDTQCLVTRNDMSYPESLQRSRL